MAPQRTDNLVSPAVSASARVQHGAHELPGLKLGQNPRLRALRAAAGLRGARAPPSGRGMVEAWGVASWTALASSLAAILCQEPLTPGFPPRFLEASQVPGPMPIIHHQIAIEAKSTVECLPFFL